MSKRVALIAGGARGMGRTLALALAVRCDVSDPEAAEEFAGPVEQKWGQIDALINCAGPHHRINLLNESIEGWHSMFDNNLHPVFYLNRVVAPNMRARKWGRIINFGMAKADRQIAQPHLSAHYIAKVGVLILTRSLARLLARDGITVNAISPGFVDSGSTPNEELESMAKNIPAGYVGSTQDAVSIVRFLFSEEASYITGANIHVSGGWGI